MAPTEVFSSWVHFAQPMLAMRRVFLRNLEGNHNCNESQILEWLESDGPSSVELPIGSIEHRVWHCPSFAEERLKYGSRCMSNAIHGTFHMATGFIQAHTTGLFPAWRHPHRLITAPQANGTFEWIMKPLGGTAKAAFDTDGSRMDDKRGGMVRFG